MNKLIIANWKMQFSHNEALSWLNQHLPELEAALSTTGNKLVICVSFTELSTAASLRTPSISFGAQDCSVYERGAYTGDISVLTLKEFNCTHVLVGHSERRICHGETDAQVAQKASLLIKHGIEPIICIGETRQERDNGVTLQVLEKQLALIVELLKKANCTKISIAYEPVWSIGTQDVPRASQISEVFSWIRDFMRKNSEHVSVILLYGGSVNDQTIGDLGLSMADGFLLGKASLDAETLKKIILKS